jgi:hypothetical protein
MLTAFVGLFLAVFVPLYLVGVTVTLIDVVKSLL